MSPHQLRYESTIAKLCSMRSQHPQLEQTSIEESGFAASEKSISRKRLIGQSCFPTNAIGIHGYLKLHRDLNQVLHIEGQCFAHINRGLIRESSQSMYKNDALFHNACSNEYRWLK